MPIFLDDNTNTKQKVSLVINPYSNWHSLFVGKVDLVFSLKSCIIIIVTKQVGDYQDGEKQRHNLPILWEDIQE